VLGRIDDGYFLRGRLSLDADAALRAVGELGARMGLSARAAALAVVEIANESMVDAIRLRTVEVGVDPRLHCLVAFGGAGPLHAAAIARRLGIRRVVVPPRPGLVSAIGALTADLRSDRVLTVHGRSDRIAADELEGRARMLRSRALSDVGAAQGEASVRTHAGLRYAGQNYEHAVELPTGPITTAALREAFVHFEALHREFYGYDLSGEVIELVDLTVTATVPSTIALPVLAAHRGGSHPVARRVHFASGSTETPVIRREALVTGDRIAGPAIVEDPDATTLIEPGDSLVVGRDGSLIIEVETEGEA
jgi:N-methylhydantoinase A